MWIHLNRTSESGHQRDWFIDTGNSRRKRNSVSVDGRNAKWRRHDAITMGIKKIPARTCFDRFLSFSWDRWLWWRFGDWLELYKSFSLLCQLWRCHCSRSTYTSESIGIKTIPLNITESFWSIFIIILWKRIVHTCWISMKSKFRSW